ncbi:hypothetical protein BDA96_07G153000 [Sorghum bicolor]|uniref:Uncharacterized protein n=2 Tax=Sorghum bicolor TaxID=4558 RepID=A0A1Z5RAZ0_SORBI|nr:hypothetical protein BDA96_07G153000 [Sorghum bicolor]OQU80546.1 hypothetical protein SORBI_3007G142400 [Sorghum bicolor]
MWLRHCQAPSDTVPLPSLSSTRSPSHDGSDIPPSPSTSTLSPSAASPSLPLRDLPLLARMRGGGLPPTTRLHHTTAWLHHHHGAWPDLMATRSDPVRTPLLLHHGGRRECMRRQVARSAGCAWSRPPPLPRWRWRCSWS